MSNEWVMDNGGTNAKCPPKGNRTHGHGGPNRTKEYRVWAHIIGRCNNPNDAGYKNYGGRGIRVCPAWRDFSAFLAAVGIAPSRLHTLDRIDNNGHYEPGNVRWATASEQSRNTRRTILVSGKCLKDVCAEKAISYEAAQMRIRRGQTPEQAISALEQKKWNG